MLKIAWKNIWRSPVRSSVVIIAVTLGLWAGIFMIAFINGMSQQRLTDILGNTLGHLKVSNQEFNEEKLPKFFIQNPEKVLDELGKDPKITAISPRVNTFGMASSSAGSFGVDMYGVKPEMEKKVFGLHQFITEGKYLEGIKRNPIVIGQELAKRLKLKLKSKIILTFQDVNGNITSGAFKVTGIYHINNTNFEESHVFMKDVDLRRLLGGEENMVHQIIANTVDFKIADDIVKKYKNSFKGSKAQSWKEVAPDLAFIDGMMDGYFLIFMGIILLALSMGILNTMLMAVLERTRELGMLMAIGMNKRRVFGMIMTETFLLTCTGLPIGILLSWTTIYITNTTGIDLSAVAEGLEEVGYSSFIRPEIANFEYLRICIMVFFAAILSAIYPAIKALKLKPAEAIRKI